MSLEQQLNSLIQYLLHAAGHTATASQLAAHLHVSTRQVRNYVTAINAASPDAPVILSTNRGYILQQEGYRYSEINEENLCPSSPVTRQDYILQKLICSTHSVDIFDLSDELHASIPTIESDLKNIRKKLSHFSVSIKRNSDILTLEGEESAKRALINTMIRTGSYGQFVLKTDFKLLTSDYDYDLLKTKLSTIFQEHSLFVNDYNFQTILLHLVIMIDRIRNNHVIHEGTWQDLSDSPAYSAVKQIRKFVMEEYEITINEEEFDNLHLIIFNNCTPVQDSLQTSPNAYIDQESLEITRKLLINVCKNYYLEPFEEAFLTQFAAHIKNLFLRVSTNYQLKNPFTAQIKMTCPLIYDISVFIAQQLFDQFHILVNDDEIAFLAFHIGGYFENNLVYKSKLTCLFVYADYYNMHLKILDKIMKSFENTILIKNAVSVLNYSKDLHADFIISTVDIPFEQEHVIISPILRTQDMERLENKVKELRQRKAGELSKRMLATFLHENLFYRMPAFSGKWEALEWLSKEALRNGYVNDAFQEDIFQRERASSTAYYELAMPHNMQDTVYQNFISILLLEKPVIWEEGKPVYMVLLLGCNQSSRKYFYQIFDYLVEVLSDAHCRQRLLACQTFPSFYDTLFGLIDEMAQA